MIPISDEPPRESPKTSLETLNWEAMKVADYSKPPVLFFGRKMGIAHDLFLKRLADFPTAKPFCRIWVS
jgi:hypothetical protein